VGRVGGIAVALGVGAAIVTGWGGGLAWADESGGTPGSTTASSSSDTQPATANADAAQETAKSVDTGATTTTRAATTGTKGSVTKDGAVRSAPAGVVVGTGGLKRDDSASATEPPPSKTAAPANPPHDGRTSKPATSKRSDPSAGKPTKKKTPAPLSAVADAKKDATPPASETRTETTEGGHANLIADRPEATGGSASPPNASTQTLSSATQGKEWTTESTAKPMSPVMTAVTRLASGFVTAILSPLAASNTPGVPTDTPATWALLAFARREFENTFTAPSPTEAPVVRPDIYRQLGLTSVDPVGVEPEQRTLILAAFPAEADAILARTTLDPNPTVVVDGRHYYLGSIGGKKVIVAMTGIGMVNATQTTETALSHFTSESGISIGAVVFSGVAGGSGRTEIGSVAVPGRWTSDDGATWHAVDPGMLAAANTLTVDLDSTATLGDPLCSCNPLAGLPLVDLKREPQLFVGGDGSSDDNNNGTAFPAIPFGGDIFGPQPCTAPDRSPLFFGNFLQAVVPFLAGGLLSNLTGLFNPVIPPVDAVDQETAAAQQVADAHGIPFLGIRGMSDGPGDPLNLPGYPFTFFVYKQIAADNAATVTEAFLRSWDGA